MRRRIVVPLTVIIAVGLFFPFFSNNVWGETLIEYNRDKDGTVRYYDSDSVNKSSGKVKVWVTVVFGDDDKLRNDLDALVKELNGISHQCQDCKGLSFGKRLIEISCREDMSHSITTTEYDTDGRALHTNETPGEWSHIIPGTVMDKLKNRVCK